jgi:hypothetical protein
MANIFKTSKLEIKTQIEKAKKEIKLPLPFY